MELSEHSLLNEMQLLCSCRGDTATVAASQPSTFCTSLKHTWFSVQTAPKMSESETLRAFVDLGLLRSGDL